jgi:Glycosyl transferase family 11
MREKKVILRLKGGLGNQLFQYAAARSIAHKNDAQLCLDTFTGYISDPFRRTFRLNHFAIRAELLPESECFHRLRQSSFVRKLRSYRERCYMRWLGRAFDPFTNKLKVRNDDVVLEGYWQSEAYFRNVADLLRKELRLKCDLSNETARLADMIRTKNSVAVHVRRLHGVSADGAKVLGRFGGTAAQVSQYDYYRKAMSIIESRRKGVCAFVFADSPEWARENVGFECPTTYVTHNGPDRDYEDLFLMSACRDHVIANSSFSWWGAWLGEHSDKLVCAPKNFSPYKGMRPLRDVYPAKWIVV